MGGVVGGIAGVALVVGGVVYMKKRRARGLASPNKAYVIQVASGKVAPEHISSPKSPKSPKAKSPTKQPRDMAAADAKDWSPAHVAAAAAGSPTKAKRPAPLPPAGKK